MKIIINRFLPIGKNFFAINIFGIIFAKGECDSITLNHEKIHTRQMKEMLFLFFYLWYLAEWIFKFAKYKDNYKAYHAISFEREAYRFQRDMDYLRKRPFWNFLKFL